VLVRRATEILADVAATEHELAGLRDRLAGRLTVGAYPTAAMALVPRAMAEVAAGHPGLAVALAEASTPALLRRLRMGRLEVAVIGVIPDLALPALAAGVRAVAVADSHWPGRATVVVTRPRPSAQAQAMVIALQNHAARLHHG
jgi:DNA-binding transcriptional LysR family regulator